jgi:type VI protein secretion system component Hcp
MMLHKLRIALAATIFALAAVSAVDSASAAIDYFLKIDGIDGESQDANYRNDIELRSWGP